MWHGVWEISEYNGDLIVAGNFIDDIVPPETTCTLIGDMEDDVYISEVTVILEATDDMTGVNRTMYKVDDGEWEEYLISFTVTEEGEHTISYYSVDNDENIEETKTEDFIIDFDPGQDITELEITITGGTGVDLTISNVGEEDAIDVVVLIEITGGLFVKPRNLTDAIERISAGDQQTVHMDVFGFGLGYVINMPTFLASASASNAYQVDTIERGRIVFTKVIIRESPTSHFFL